MNAKKPLLICLTATRNYRWVTRAFLETNSQWADYIIVVDQMSTDGTRIMCAEYDNVILVDNKDLTYNEKTRCELALGKAREIPCCGCKILVYLAIDEILPANWMETDDGRSILESRPGDMFILNWANILPDKYHYKPASGGTMYRILNDDGVTPYNSDGLVMHTYCLPYVLEGKEHVVNDFPIIHFDLYNVAYKKVKNWYYYQMVDFNHNHGSAVKLSRYYRHPINSNYTKGDGIIDPLWLEWNFNVFDLIDLNEEPFLYEEIKRFISDRGAKHYRKLDIWDKELIEHLNLKDPRNLWDKLLHVYLHATFRWKDTFFIHVVDKVLKLLHI